MIIIRRALSKCSLSHQLPYVPGEPSGCSVAMVDRWVDWEANVRVDALRGIYDIPQLLASTSRLDHFDLLTSQRSGSAVLRELHSMPLACMLDMRSTTRCHQREAHRLHVQGFHQNSVIVSSCLASHSRKSTSRFFPSPLPYRLSMAPRRT